MMNRSITARFTAMALLVAALLLSVGFEARAQRGGPITISNNVSCAVTVCVANSSCITLFPGSTIRFDIPCDVTTVTFISCGVAKKISLGDCITAANVGDCCADVCFVPGIIACTSFLSFDPTLRRCPCLLE